MSTTPVNISMFDPTGQVRQIPMPSVKDALAAGGKLAVRMADPQGVERWVPHDMREQALAAGGKMLEDPTDHPQIGALANATYHALAPFNLVTLPVSGGRVPNILDQAWYEASAMIHHPLETTKEALLSPVRSIAGGAQQELEAASKARAESKPAAAAVRTLYSGIPILGPQMGQAAEQSARGDIYGAVGTAAGLGLQVGVMSPELPGAVRSGATALANRVMRPKPPIAVAPAQVEAMASFIDSRAGAVDPYAMASEVTPVLQRQAAADGLNLSKLEGRAVGHAALRTVKNAVNTLANEVTTIQKPYANTIVDQTPIARAYLDRVTDELKANDRPAANRLMHEARKYAQIDDAGNIVGPKPASLEQIDLLRRRLNNETAAAQSRAEGAYRKTAWETQADVAAVAAARDVQYGNLARLSGVDEPHIRALQRQEGQLLEMRDSLSREINRVSEAQAGAVAGSLRANPPGSGRFSTALREKVGHTYPSRAGVERSIIHEFVGPKPLETMNNRLRLAFGGGGTAPATTMPPPTMSAPVPPTPTAPTAPTVTLGPGAEGLSGTTRSINIGGQKAGTITYEISGDTATIHHFGGPESNYNVLSNKLGRQGLQDVVQQLKQQHPEITHVQGIRVGGARGGEGRSVRIEIPKEPSPAAQPAARQENAFYTQARAELGANATPEQVQARVAQMKAQGVQMPAPPPSIVHRAATGAHPLTGAQRAAATAAIMSQLKNGEIGQREADRRIQKITGGGGRKLVRMPEAP